MTTRTRRMTMPGAERRTQALADEELLLHTGDRLTQAEFHRLYEMSPPGFSAELIGGVVHVSSPVKDRHADDHARVLNLLQRYADDTEGVAVRVTPTFIVDDVNEPQPDGMLLIEPECGGQSKVTKAGYRSGSPELLAEVGDSSRRIDLGEKRQAYRAAGVLEYIVVNVPERKVHLFDLNADEEVEADADGVIRSRVFPGLWIDASRYFDQTNKGCRRTLARGLRSKEHARFVKALAARRKKRKRSK